MQRPSFDVLLDKQVALLIRGGNVRRVISVSTGAAGSPTPRGSFRVNRKERMSWSVPYKVWLPYASYFNGGIALHEGSSVPAYAASHGCVRISMNAAEWFPDKVPMGTPVYVIGEDGEVPAPLPPEEPATTSTTMPPETTTSAPPPTVAPPVPTTAPPLLPPLFGSPTQPPPEQTTTAPAPPA